MNTISKIGIVLLILAALLGAFAWGSATIFQGRTQVADTRLTIETRHGNDNWTLSIKKIQSEYGKQLNVVDDAAITKAGLIALIDTLEQVGKKSGLMVSITSIAEDSGAAGAPQVVRMTIETTGPWAPTMAFIRTIENLPHKISIDDTNINLLQGVWRSGITLKITTFPENS